MKLLADEIIRIWKKNPVGISAIWFLDFYEAVLLAFNPLLIGLCIDGLLSEDYKWFIVLIIIEFLYLVSHTINIFFDTRIYSKISKEERNRYYSEAINSTIDDSTINSRLERTDDVVEFLEFGIIDISKTLIGIITSLIYIFINSHLFVFGLAIVITVLIPLLTKNIRSKINVYIERNKDLDEENQNQIVSRNNNNYEKYTDDKAKTEIKISDLDTILFTVKQLCRIMILAVVIIATINMDNVTEGLLFATITYTVMLWEYINEIDEIHIDLCSLRNTLIRLNKKEL